MTLAEQVAKLEKELKDERIISFSREAKDLALSDAYALLETQSNLIASLREEVNGLRSAISKIQAATAGLGL